MSYISIDVEADGPIPGDYSMISFGAVVVEPSLTKTFYAQLKPISDLWIPEALEISRFTREKTLTFEDPQVVMARFDVIAHDREYLKTISQIEPGRKDFVLARVHEYHGWEPPRFRGVRFRPM